MFPPMVFINQLPGSLSVRTMVIGESKSLSQEQATILSTSG